MKSFSNMMPVICLVVVIFSWALTVRITASSEPINDHRIGYSQFQVGDSPLPTPTPTDTPKPHPTKTPPRPDIIEPCQKQTVIDPRNRDTSLRVRSRSVPVPAQLLVYCDALPPDTPPIPHIDCYKFVTIRERGTGEPITDFRQSVSVIMRYFDGELKALTEALRRDILETFLEEHGVNSIVDLSDEEQTELDDLIEQELKLYMYNPATEVWLKVCSDTDVYDNLIYGEIAKFTPFTEGNHIGNALFAISVDGTPKVTQEVDERGVTTLTLPQSNFRLHVPPGAVRLGSHFEITKLKNPPKDPGFEFLPDYVDVKACFTDHQDRENSEAIRSFYKGEGISGEDLTSTGIANFGDIVRPCCPPLEVELGYENYLLEANNGTPLPNLEQLLTTVGNLYTASGDWQNLEKQSNSDEQSLRIQTYTLGTFSLAFNQLSEVEEELEIIENQATTTNNNCP